MMKSMAMLPLAVLTLANSHPNEQVPLTPLESPSSPASVGTIPLLGFGTWQLKEKNTSEAVSYAIQVGYRHIDAAAAYGNEEEVGEGIRDGLLRTGLQREDLWITSKLWNDKHDPNLVEPAIDSSLHKLGLTYLDLYLMHFPVASTLLSGNKIAYRETWGAMTLLQQKGKTRQIGVSNFSPDQLLDLLNNTSVAPAVHQMELHLYLQQDQWVEFHNKHGIHVTAYSPLAGTNPDYDDDHDDPPTPLLKNKVVHKIAKKRDCSPAQVALKWGLLRGTSVIPKSIHKEYIEQNFNATGCALNEKDLKKLEKLGKHHFRYNNPSEILGLQLYEGLEDDDGKHGRAKYWDRK